VFDGFIESAVYKAATKARHSHGVSYSVEVPGTIKAAGDPILSSQFTPIVTDPSPPPLHYAPMPSVYDLFRVVPITGASSVRFFLATMPIAVNAVGWVTEGTAKPEVQPRWTPKDAPLEVVAEWTAVTLQALDDVPQLRSVLFDDLRNLLMWKINDGLINGTGVAPQILGIVASPGIQTQAFTTDAITSILAGITKVSASNAGYPTGIVMNPADWATVRSTVSAGIWVFGSPTESGVMRLFGVPVVTTSAHPVGFATVGDFSFGTIFERWGVTFIVGLKNDDLIKNIQTIVCEARLALAIRRPSAFCYTDIIV
jgi:HK97 family phage major capsid protein